MSLVKLGTNTLTLSGANTYSNTTINGGALRLNSALGSGNLTLNGGALSTTALTVTVGFSPAVMSEAAKAVSLSLSRH